MDELSGKGNVKIMRLLLLAVPVLAACHPMGGPVAQASLLAERGQYPEAILMLEEKTAGGHVPLAPLRQLMRLYAVVGDWTKVTHTFRRLEKLHPPDSPEPWVELGHAYELSHDYSEALAAYDRAAEIAPSNCRGPAVAGNRAARWGEWQLAEDRLREALRRAPNDSHLYHSLGFVLFSAGRNEEARRAYRRGLKAFPTALGNRLGLATVALSEKKPAEALVHYEALIEVRPTFAAAYLGRSWALLLLGRLSAASLALRLAQEQGADPEVVERQRQHLQKALVGRPAQGLSGPAL